LSNSLWKEIL